MSIPNELSSYFKSWPTFRIEDAFLFLRKRHRLSKKTLQVTLSRMAKSARLYRVSKGVFSFTKSAEVAGFAYAPFYYGGLSALMIRDLIDDQVRMEVMTTRAVRRNSSTAFGEIEILLHHLSREHYFGFDEVVYGNYAVPVSNPEKTLIDLFHYKIRLPLQEYGRLLRAVDAKKLDRYLRAYGSRTSTAVLSFFKRYKPLADAGRLSSPY